jgi:2-dehydro-3-deoxyphosphogluconate aldolase/(4S)-4-hydroxy-2-oxoglutarate aldolase
MMQPRGAKAVEEAIAAQKILPVLRLRGEPIPMQLVEVLLEEGLRCVEIAMTTPRALTTLREIRRRWGERVVLGAGSALNREMAQLAVRAGAEFIASPGLNEAMVDYCRRHDLLVMPGIMTPTEAMRAWHAGAQLVKVFPASVLGPAFLHALRGPLPWVRCVPTGGINAANLVAFMEAGAVAVGVGEGLAPEEEVAARHWQAIQARLRELRAALPRSSS